MNSHARPADALARIAGAEAKQIAKRAGLYFFDGDLGVVISVLLPTDVVISVEKDLGRKFSDD